MEVFELDWLELKSQSTPIQCDLTPVSSYLSPSPLTQNPAPPVLPELTHPQTCRRIRSDPPVATQEWRSLDSNVDDQHSDADGSCRDPAYRSRILLEEKRMQQPASRRCIHREFTVHVFSQSCSMFSVPLRSDDVTRE